MQQTMLEFARRTGNRFQELVALSLPASKNPHGLLSATLWPLREPTPCTIGASRLVARARRPRQTKSGGNRGVDDLIEGRLTLARDPDGAPPPLDATARASYRTRIRELDRDLDEAERFNDSGRATRIREELDALKDELGARIGIGGRARKTGSHSERARLMVSNNIRLAIAKIRRECPSLGRYLSTTIRTGYFCSY